MKDLNLKFNNKQILPLLTVFGLIYQTPLLAQENQFNPDIEIKQDEVRTKNGNASYNPQITIGGERQDIDPDAPISVNNNGGARIYPSTNIDLNNGSVDSSVSGGYNPSVNVGGNNGVKVNPNITYQDERLRIDPEFDYTGAANYVKDKAIDYAKNFIFNKLGVDNFLTTLQQNFSEITGDVTTFLGIRGEEVDIGSAGIPNVQEARLAFYTQNDLDPLSDMMGSKTGSTFTNREKLMQHYLSDLANGISENSALSLRGQSIITGNIETANEIAQKSAAVAEDSAKQDISQNIMRNGSIQEDLRLQLDTLNYVDRQEAKINDALSMEIAVETMNEVSQANTRKQREAEQMNSTAENGLTMFGYRTK